MGELLIYLCCFLFIVFVPSTLGDWQDGDDGVDRPLGDLSPLPIELNFEARPSDCAALCTSYKFSGCKGWVFFKRDCGGQIKPTCRLKDTLNNQTNNSCAVSGLLSPPKMFWGVYRPLPLRSILPQGWLKEQLKIQAKGLSGHLPMFWKELVNSSWFGGHSDGLNHENVPYWLNGFLPLAYQLGDNDLISLVYNYVDYILSNQTEEGWMGPDDIGSGNMYWSKFPLLLALRQYYEASSTDTRVIPAIMKLLKCIHKRLFVTPLGYSWSGARWYELVLTVHWMLQNHPSGEEQMLWDLAELAHQQGFDWTKWFGDKFPKEAVSNATLYTHGVNNGQAIKSEAVWYQQSQDDSDIEATYLRIQKLDQYHGQASGIFGCDEHLAGNMPSRGTELCTVVETMFSFEVLFHIIGDPQFAERAEQLTYNALPATITSDMWAHQYLQQSNQMQVKKTDIHVWTHDGPASTLYGLEPNFPCCTANFNQGWPKFAQNLVMETADGRGLVIAMYAPAYVKHKLSNGGEVVMNITTDYPFDDTVFIDVDCGVDLLLLLRIPSWADIPTVTVNRGLSKTALSGTLHKMTCEGLTEIVLKLPMKIKVTKRYNNAASIYRGPLLYGLHIHENFTTLHKYKFKSKDYQVTPESPWNYAIRLRNEDFVVVESGIKKEKPPFSFHGSPVRIRVKGRLLDPWKELKRSAAAPPYSPVKSSNPLRDIELLPYGATNLRIAEFPHLDEY